MSIGEDQERVKEKKQKDEGVFLLDIKIYLLLNPWFFLNRSMILNEGFSQTEIRMGKKSAGQIRLFNNFLEFDIDK